MFHDDEEPPSIVPKVMYGDNVGVGEVGGGFGFLAEAFAKGRVFGKSFPQNFDGNGAFQHEVAGFVDNSHSAFADTLLEGVAVVEKGGVLCHGGRILSRGGELLEIGYQGLDVAL